MNKNIFGRILIKFIVGLVISTSLCVILSGWLYLSIEFVDENLTTLYTTQISLVFIILSFVTVLSSNTRSVYWEDIVQYRMINPKWTSIVDMASYIFSNLLISTIAFLFNLRMGLFSFLITLLLVAYLSIHLLASYFGIETLKKELEKNIRTRKELVQ